VGKVRIIQEHLRAAQDRQKSWADISRRPLEFKMGEYVFLKISPTNGVIRFGVRGNFSPRYIGPFEILELVRDVAYSLALLPSLKGVHNVFHVSQLCVRFSFFPFSYFSLISFFLFPTSLLLSHLSLSLALISLSRSLISFSLPRARPCGVREFLRYCLVLCDFRREFLNFS